jgi:hypothetical protein
MGWNAKAVKEVEVAGGRVEWGWCCLRVDWLACDGFLEFLKSHFYTK